jgi:hypothetical protein
MLVKTDLMDIFVHTGGIKFKTNDGYGQGKRHSLHVWLETFHAWNILSEGGGTVALHFQKADRDISFPPLTRPDSSEDCRWNNSIIEIVDAALDLRGLAGAQDNPVDIDELIREAKKITNARAMMTGRHELSPLSFTTPSSIEGMKLDEADFLFISAIVIGDELYAYALRATMMLCLEGNSAHWTSRKLLPLVVERLENHPIEAYRAFREKMTRISGIDYVIQQMLIENTSEHGERGQFA